MPRLTHAAALLLAAAPALAAAAALARSDCAPPPDTPGGPCSAAGGCPFAACPRLAGVATCAPPLPLGAPCDEGDPAAGVCGAGLVCGEHGVGVCGRVVGLLARCGDGAGGSVCWRADLGVPGGVAGAVDLRCEAGACVEDRDGGAGVLCAVDEDACARARGGAVCAEAQDGQRRCLAQAASFQECFLSPAHERLAPFACAAGDVCSAGQFEKDDQWSVGQGLQMRYCFAKASAAEGEACDSSGGGVACGAGLTCARDELAASERCARVVADGEACGSSAGGAVCAATWPAVARCTGGVCSVDASAQPPCGTGSEAVQILRPSGDRKVSVCVRWRQQAGDRCQTAVPLGGVYREFRCAEDSGLECRQPPGAGRFDMDGTCFTVPTQGGR